MGGMPPGLLLRRNFCDFPNWYLGYGVYSYTRARFRGQSAHRRDEPQASVFEPETDPTIAHVADRTQEIPNVAPRTTLICIDCTYSVAGAKDTRPYRDTSQQDIAAIASGRHQMDAFVRLFIHENLSYRFVILSDGAAARKVEAIIKRGGWGHGQPHLNPTR
jgi:hypothetical protein